MQHESPQRPPRAQPPSIENLRKQAKRLVRWHRDGVRSVAGIIRAAFPELGGKSDAELLATRFALHDALDVIARQNGHRTWLALMRASPLPEKANDMTATHPPTLLAVHPQLFVDDIDIACAYFAERLGFDTVFKHGSPAFYAQVGRDGVRLNLRCAVPSPIDRERASAEAFLSAYVMVDDVRTLYGEYLARGAPMHQPLRRAPWNMDEFVVKDPSGNLILFASDVQT